jgi:hypothetical protein
MGAGDLKKMNGIITKMGRGFRIPSRVSKKERREKLKKFTKVGHLRSESENGAGL